MKELNAVLLNKRRNIFKRGTRGETTGIWIMFAVFIVYAVTLLYPFIWMFVNSFKTSFEFRDFPFAFPKSLHVENFKSALFDFKILAGGGSNVKEFNLIAMFGISLILTLAGTVLDTLFSAMLAYTVAKYKFRGRGIIYAVIIFALIVPLVGTLPSLYRLLDNTKLINTLPGAILMYAKGYGFAFLLFFGYFKSVSWSYAEAAFVDGATDFGVFFRIILPLSKPAIISVAIISGISIWNDYGIPSLFLRSYPTLAVGVNTLSARLINGENNYPVMFATILIATLPIVIVFAVFQKTIIENTVAGGLKG